MGISLLHKEEHEQKEYFSSFEWAQTYGDSIPFCQHMSRLGFSGTISTHIPEILKAVPVVVC